MSSTDATLPSPVQTTARRAAALLVHHQDGNGEGVSAVLDEVRNSADTTYLLLGLLGLFEHLLRECPADTIARTRAAVLQLASREEPTP